jgi:cytochrome c peroxidase
LFGAGIAVRGLLVRGADLIPLRIALSSLIAVPSLASASCHQPPYYTDNLMHNLKAERFYKPRTINGMMASVDGPIKTFSLRGIKDSPPYLHDGRLLTLADTVEFFNMFRSTKVPEA